VLCHLYDTPKNSLTLPKISVTTPCCRKGLFIGSITTAQNLR
jgi:hypothetical protein